MTQPVPSEEIIAENTLTRKEGRSDEMLVRNPPSGEYVLRFDTPDNSEEKMIER